MKTSKQLAKTELAWASGNLILYNILIVFSIIMYTIIKSGLVMLQTGKSLAADDLQTMANQDSAGYFLAVLVGLLIFTVFKEGKLWTDYIKRKNRSMTVKQFMIFVAFLYLGQFAFTIVASIGEAILNLFNLSMMTALEAASAGSTDWTMFFYAGFLAPISEELIFRGTIMRAFQPYSKVYAIGMSSLLFGVFHANIPQSIFATLLGLVLGYVAIEYSIVWAIIFHIVNNLVMGDFVVWLLGHLSDGLSELISLGLNIGGSIIALIVLYKHRKEIVAYLKRYKPEKGLVRTCLTSIWFWCFVLFMLIQSLFLISRIS